MILRKIITLHCIMVQKPTRNPAPTSQRWTRMQEQQFIICCSFLGAKIVLLLDFWGRLHFQFSIFRLPWYDFSPGAVMSRSHHLSRQIWEETQRINNLQTEKALEQGTFGQGWKKYCIMVSWLPSKFKCGSQSWLGRSFYQPPYGWNLPGSTSLIAECHQIMCKADLLLGSFF